LLFLDERLPGMFAASYTHDVDVGFDPHRLGIHPD